MPAPPHAIAKMRPDSNRIFMSATQPIGLQLLQTALTVSVGTAVPTARTVTRIGWIALFGVGCRALLDASDSIFGWRGQQFIDSFHERPREIAASSLLPDSSYPRLRDDVVKRAESVYEEVIVNRALLALEE